jgi:di/tricarboxylate transporter
LKKKYKNLGPIKWNQICVGIIFLILVILWLTRDLHFMPGWGALFKEK